MLDFLKFCKSFVKNEVVHTDNCIFKLHYRFTVIVLIISSILITTKQFFGDPINCEIDGISTELYDSYCWIYSIYTIKKTMKNSILPGLGPHPDHKLYTSTKFPFSKTLNLPRQDEEIVEHKYYQWICIVLCLQAILFYIPRYIWKSWEAGRLRLLAKDLGGPFTPLSWNQELKDSLINFILCGKSSHNLYAIRFIFCEFLNLLNVSSQIIAMDWFLSNQFSGLRVFMETINGSNPMAKVFPKLAKCTYYRYGFSGSIESKDGLCVLPLNVFNEKLYLLMWFWFYCLAFLSALTLLYRLLFFCVPHMRVYLLMARAKYVNKQRAAIVVNRTSFGNFFVLYQLGKNLNPSVYRELVIGISHALQTSKVKGLGAEVSFPV